MENTVNTVPTLMTIHAIHALCRVRGLDTGSFAGALFALTRGYLEDDLHAKLACGYPISALSYKGKYAARVIDGLSETKEDFALLYQDGRLLGGFASRKDGFQYLQALGEEENPNFDVVGLKLV